jgi:hypothetical protein
MSETEHRIRQRKPEGWYGLEAILTLQGVISAEWQSVVDYGSARQGDAFPCRWGVFGSPKKGHITNLSPVSF